MARISNWTQNPKGFYFATLWKVYDKSTLLHNHPLAIFFRESGDKRKRLVICLTKEEAARLQADLNELLGDTPLVDTCPRCGALPHGEGPCG
jgi:hypothetical protein